MFGNLKACVLVGKKVWFTDEVLCNPIDVSDDVISSNDGSMGNSSPLFPNATIGKGKDAASSSSTASVDFHSDGISNNF